MTDDDHPRGRLVRFDEPTPLEMEAGRLVATRGGSWGTDEPVLDMIEREIKAVLDQTDELRSLHTDLDRDLLRSECRIGTDLLGLRQPMYGPDDRAPLRASLKARLEQMRRERRSISLELHGRHRFLVERLTLLLERHRQIRGDDAGAKGRGR